MTLKPFEFLEQFMIDTFLIDLTQFEKQLDYKEKLYSAGISLN